MYQPTYHFPVLRGIQAEREFYLAMCPLKLVPKLFLYDEITVPTELRAQRVLNKARIPDIAKYIINNPKEYIFSALTASIDAEVEFKSLGDQNGMENIGELIIPMDSKIIINDGQHRRAAIEEALEMRPELADESIAVVFFIDAGLRKSQQMFADLNKHAIRPSLSIGVLYDHRDPLADLSRKVMMQVPTFKNLIEKEKTSISNRSPKLFTLSVLYQANKALLRKKANDSVTDTEIKLAIAYWKEICKFMPDWILAANKEISCSHLREEFVHAHGVTLQAIGITGAELISQHPNDWKSFLPKIKTIDWNRSNTDLWEGRAMSQGRISKAERHVKLTANLIKKALELPLSFDEQEIEEGYISTKGNLQ
jgi:DNA sulfur modification protein DndB